MKEKMLQEIQRDDCRDRKHIQTAFIQKSEPTTHSPQHNFPHSENDRHKQITDNTAIARQNIGTTCPK